MLATLPWHHHSPMFVGGNLSGKSLKPLPISCATCGTTALPSARALRLVALLFRPFAALPFVLRLSGSCWPSSHPSGNPDGCATQAGFNGAFSRMVDDQPVPCCRRLFHVAHGCHRVCRRPLLPDHRIRQRRPNASAFRRVSAAPLRLDVAATSSPRIPSGVPMPFPLECRPFLSSLRKIRSRRRIPSLSGVGRNEDPLVDAARRRRKLESSPLCIIPEVGSVPRTSRFHEK